MFLCWVCFLSNTAMHYGASFHRHLSRNAAELHAGCPLDLDIEAFPEGMCTRTIFGKAEIVLWRTGPVTFRVECGRSFAPYVVGLMAEAMRDAG